MRRARRKKMVSPALLVHHKKQIVKLQRKPSTTVLLARWKIQIVKLPRKPSTTVLLALWKNQNFNQKESAKMDLKIRTIITLSWLTLAHRWLTPALEPKLPRKPSTTVLLAPRRNQNSNPAQIPRTNLIFCLKATLQNKRSRRSLNLSQAFYARIRRWRKPTWKKRGDIRRNRGHTSTLAVACRVVFAQMLKN